VTTLASCPCAQHGQQETGTRPPHRPRTTNGLAVLQSLPYPISYAWARARTREALLIGADMHVRAEEALLRERPAAAAALRGRAAGGRHARQPCRVCRPRNARSRPSAQPDQGCSRCPADARAPRGPPPQSATPLVRERRGRRTAAARLHGGQRHAPGGRAQPDLPHGRLGQHAARQEHQCHLRAHP